MCVCWCVCMVKTLKSLWQSNAKSKSEIEIRKRNFQVDFIRWQTRTSKILVLKGHMGVVCVSGVCSVCGEAWPFSHDCALSANCWLLAMEQLFH